MWTSCHNHQPVHRMGKQNCENEPPSIFTRRHPLSPPSVQSYSRGTRSRDRTGGHEALGTTLKAYKRERRRGGPHLPRETPVFSSISWWLASVAINTDCTRESHSNPADSHSRFLSNRRKKCRVMPHMATYTVRVY